MKHTYFYNISSLTIKIGRGAAADTMTSVQSTNLSPPCREDSTNFLQVINLGYYTPRELFNCLTICSRMLHVCHRICGDSRVIKTLQIGGPDEGQDETFLSLFGQMRIFTVCMTLWILTLCLYIFSFYSASVMMYSTNKIPVNSI